MLSLSSHRQITLKIRLMNVLVYVLHWKLLYKPSKACLDKANSGEIIQYTLIGQNIAKN